MILKTSNSIFRNKLNKIISSDNGMNWCDTELFEKNIHPILPKELEILEPPPKKEKRYNCYSFVVGFHKEKEFFGDKRVVFNS